LNGKNKKKDEKYNDDESKTITIKPQEKREEN
jgi:hypothetical protein